MTQNSWNSEFNSAKGALLVGNATRPIVEPVGADGFVLTADSAQATGVAWAAGFNPANTAAFLYSLTTAATNVTGAGTNWIFGTTGGGAATMIVDNGSNVTLIGSDYTFTAPVTGLYMLGGGIDYSPITAAMNYSTLAIVTNTGGSFFNQHSIDATKVTTYVVSGMGIVPMTAGDTAKLAFTVAGGAGDTVGITNGTLTTFLSYFQGYLFSTAGGVSGIFGPGVSTDRAIATWNGITGTAQYDNPTTRITALGEMTNTGQPAFYANMSANALNATGDGTLYQIIGDNIVSQQGTGYNNGTGLFTCPVTGWYFFATIINVNNLLVTHTSGTWIITPSAGAVPTTFAMNPFVTKEAAGGFCIPSLSGITFLTAGTTVGAYVTVSGGTKTVTVAAGSTFQGALLF